LGNPSLLILDEPTVGLDPKQILEVRELIKELGKKRAVIFSSHILQEIQAVSDRIIIINNGALIADNTPQQFSALGISLEEAFIKLIVGNSSDFSRILKAGVNKDGKANKGGAE
jgi:ABC-2 type transport system ATP-binding protein